MTRKSKNSKRKCKARKSTIKNRRGKGGIFSCANKSNSYESKSGPKSLFRENSQDSTKSDEYGNFCITDTKENPPQTKVTASYTGKTRSKIHKKNKNKTS